MKKIIPFFLLLFCISIEAFANPSKWPTNPGYMNPPFGGPADINVQGNSITIIDGDLSPSISDHTDFGVTTTCSGTVVRTFTIQNIGFLTLSITSVVISGAHAADFTVTSSPASLINPGFSTTFQVSFDPSAAGLRTATITINSNDPDEAAYDYAIQGTGSDPEVNIQGNSNNIPDGQLTPSGSNHTGFGPILVCTGTNTRTYTIQNTGTNTLNISGTSITGLHASDFTVTLAPPATIAAASSAIFQVTFDPSAAGSRQATVNVFNDDCDEATYDYAIQGTGNADIVAPTAVCQNISVNLNGSGNASITGAMINNGSSDACGIASLNAAPTSFTCANVGANTVTLTVTDNSGNTSTCNATVTVVDNITPTAVCQNINAYIGPSGLSTITGAMLNNGSSDACGILSLSANPNAIACINLGATIPFTLTVTDNNGNTSTCISQVTVLDTLDPVVICQNATVNLDATGNASIGFATIDNGSSDNCAMAGFNVSPNSFTCANVGTNTVTLTITDNSGNFSTCTSTVTIVDNIAPSVACQNLTVYLDATGNAVITAAMLNNGSSDVCGIASLSANTTAFTCADVGANSVVLTVTDVNGNTATCTSTVTVMDTIQPNAVCQNITVALGANGTATITGSMVDNGSTDICGIATLVVSPNTFSCANVGANPAMLTVTDNNGNVSTCSAIVTIDPPNPINQNIDICFGESYTVGSNTYNTNGTYTDSLTNIFGCDSIIITTLTVAPIIDNTTQLSGVTITANAFATSYQWLDCNNGNAPLVGETSQSFMATANGDYSVVITINGCSDTSACVNIDNVGIQDMIDHIQIQLFPNPTDGLVQLNIQDLETENLEIDIMNIYGSVVSIFNPEKISGSFSKVYDLGELSAGMYIIRAKANGNSAMLRFIKNR